MRHVTRFRKSIVVYFAVFVFLVYLFFRYGIQLFIDSAFYLSGAKRDTTQSTTKTNNQQSAINVDPMLIDVPHATNEATLTLTGRANSGNKIYLYQNDQRVDTTTSDYDGNLQFLVTLTPGENDIYIKSVDETTQKKTDSPVYQLNFLNKVPTLDIKDPTDGKRVYQADIVVNGTTDSEVFVTINGRSVVVRADGSFTQPLALQRGDNTIRVKAQDVAGNLTEKSLKVTFVQ
jgi:hypothetical protein